MWSWNIRVTTRNISWDDVNYAKTLFSTRKLLANCLINANYRRNTRPTTSTRGCLPKSTCPTLQHANHPRISLHFSKMKRNARQRAHHCWLMTSRSTPATPLSRACWIRKKCVKKWENLRAKNVRLYYEQKLAIKFWKIKIVFPNFPTVGFGIKRPISRHLDLGSNAWGKPRGIAARFGRYSRGTAARPAAYLKRKMFNFFKSCENVLVPVQVLLVKFSNLWNLANFLRRIFLGRRGQ